MIRKFKSSYADPVTLHDIQRVRDTGQFPGLDAGMNVKVAGEVVGRVFMTADGDYGVFMLVEGKFKNIARGKYRDAVYLTWTNAVETLLLRWSRQGEQSEV